MSRYYDALETRGPELRERELFARLPEALAAALKAPAYAERLAGIDPREITDRNALSLLPVLRKADLPGLHRAAPPFGGFAAARPGEFARLFTSPGPIFEGEPAAPDPWGSARSCFAAGLRAGDVVLNTFSYHLTPGGFIMDAGARAIGCAVIPAGPGNTEAQLDLIEAFRPVGYCGTPDFLKILLEAADAAGRDASSIRRAVVSGAAFPPSLQEWVRGRGIEAFQTFATADFGAIAYESEAREGLILNEDLILEIVAPGTGYPLEPGEIGEMVVTSLDSHAPVIRLAIGDLSALMPGPSPCGRTNARIRGWLGRADQTTKIKGMFVRPEQVAEISRRHPEISRARLVVGRAGETDTMTLKVDLSTEPAGLIDDIAATLHALTKLRGVVQAVPPGSLPNDGKVIADERPLG